MCWARTRSPHPCALHTWVAPRGQHTPEALWLPVGCRGLLLSPTLQIILMWPPPALLHSCHSPTLCSLAASALGARDVRHIWLQSKSIISSLANADGSERKSETQQKIKLEKGAQKSASSPPTTLPLISWMRRAAPGSLSPPLWVHPGSLSESQKLGGTAPAEATGELSFSGCSAVSAYILYRGTYRNCKGSISKPPHKLTSNFRWEILFSSIWIVWWCNCETFQRIHRARENNTEGEKLKEEKRKIVRNCSWVWMHRSAPAPRHCTHAEC